MIKPLSNLLRHRIALAAIGASAALQLATINRYSFWFDESFTAALLKFGPSQIINLTSLDVHPPLYYLLLKGYSLIFGTSDFALRSFSLIFMVISLTLLYRLLLRLVNHRSALIGLWFAALGPFVVRYGQEARMYGLNSALIIGSTLVLVRQTQMAKKQRQNRWWVVYALLVSAIMYTHYFGALIVLIHGLYMLTLHRKERSLIGRVKGIDSGWLLSMIGAGILYLPWLPTLLKQFNTVNGGFWIPPVSPRSFADTFGWFYWFNDLYKYDNHALGALAFVMLWLLGVAVAIVWRRKLVDMRALLLLIMPLVMVALVLYGLSSLPKATSLFYFRYFSQFSMLFYAGVGVVLASLSSKKLRYGSLMSVVMAGVMLMQLVGVARVLQGFGKTNNQSKLLYSRMLNEYQEGDAILTAGFENFYDFDHYNRTSSPTKLMPQTVDYGSLAPIKKHGDVIIEPSDLHPTSGRVWYFRSFFYSTDVLPKEWVKVESVQELAKGEQILELYLVK